MSKLLTRQEGGEVNRWGYDIGGPWAWHLLPWIWSNGGDVTDAAITTASGYLDGSATWRPRADRRVGDGRLFAPNIFQQGFDSWGSFVNGQLAAVRTARGFPVGSKRPTPVSTPALP